MLCIAASRKTGPIHFLSRHKEPFRVYINRTEKLENSREVLVLLVEYDSTKIRIEIRVTIGSKYGTLHTTFFTPKGEKVSIGASRNLNECFRIVINCDRGVSIIRNDIYEKAVDIISKEDDQRPNAERVHKHFDEIRANRRAA